MPGPLSHLFIADQVAQTVQLALPDHAIQQDHFLAGSLVPDAVHARQPFDRANKKISHFKQGILDSELHKPEFLALFESRVQEFAATMTGMEAHRESYFLGYLCHIFTDCFFILHVRPSIISNYNLHNREPQNGITADHFYQEMDAMDTFFHGRFARLEGVVRAIQKVESLDVHSLVSKSEADSSRNWVVDRLAKKEYAKPLRFLTDADVLSFQDTSIPWVSSRIAGIKTWLGGKAGA